MKDVETASDKIFPRGIWLIFVYYGIKLSIETSQVIEEWLGAKLEIPQTRFGGEPPLYFIRNDLVDAYVSAIVVIAALLLVVIVYRRYPLGARLIVLFSLLHFVPDMLIGMDISLRCENLSSDTAASCPWPTFESYLWNARHQVFHYATWLIVLVYAVAVRRQINRRQQSGMPAFAS